MTTTYHAETTRERSEPRTALQVVAGVSLVLAGVLNGLPQFLVHALTGDHGTFSDQIRWSVDHAGIHRAEQLTILVSTLFLPIGLLGLAWLARHPARRLAGLAAVLVVWGMWGFHNVLAMGYTVGTVGPGAVGVEDAVRLNEALIDDTGAVFSALLPHLVGSFFGILLLMVACWRSGVFPRTPLVLTVAFLVWDFALAPVGPLEAHLLLVVAWVWLGLHVLQLPAAVWRGTRVGDRQGAASSY